MQQYIKKLSFYSYGGGNKVIIGNNCHLNGVNFYCNSDNNLINILDDVIVNASRKQPTCLNACDGQTISIGQRCLLSNSIEIHTTDYHKIFDEQDNIENSPRDVVIGNHVWIGLQCLILKGVKIADDCVVGARSLLTKEYNQKNTIIVGNPAKTVKNHIKWKIK